MSWDQFPGNTDKTYSLNALKASAKCKTATSLLHLFDGRDRDDKEKRKAAGHRTGGSVDDQLQRETARGEISHIGQSLKGQLTLTEVT